MEIPETTGEKQDTKFKKGVSGNPLGRPKGSGGGLKDYDRNKFKEMSNDDKDAFLDKLTHEVRYKMAEGNPHQTEEKSIDATVTVVEAPKAIIDKLKDGINSETE